MTKYFLICTFSVNLIFSNAPQSSQSEQYKTVCIQIISPKESYFQVIRYHNIFIRFVGSGAVAGKILLVTNACWIFDYLDVSRSSSARNNPRTANGYKSWNLQFSKNPSTTNYEIFLVLAIFPFLLFITLFSYTSPTIKVVWTFLSKCYKYWKNFIIIKSIQSTLNTPRFQDNWPRSPIKK